MSRDIVIQPAAKRDLQEACDWYESREAGLFARFLDDVESTLQWIMLHKELCLKVHARVSMKPCRRFPYWVYFLAEGYSLIVIAVLHNRRDEGHWRKRV